MWQRDVQYPLVCRSFETFDLEPTQNCIADQVSLVTSHQSLGYLLDYKGFVISRVKS